MSDVEETGTDDTGAVAPGTTSAPTAAAVCEYLVKALVDEPGGVEVDVIDGRRTTVEVHVAPGDMGRVIGKRGRVAQSIRTVVRAAAARDGVEIDVEFVE